MTRTNISACSTSNVLVQVRHRRDEIVRVNKDKLGDVDVEVIAPLTAPTLAGACSHLQYESGMESTIQ